MYYDDILLVRYDGNSVSFLNYTEHTRQTGGSLSYALYQDVQTSRD